MKRDPFYQQIVAGLSRPLDPDVFERCAADILRSEWPTLVPVRGGGDAGMDGAVADGDGTAFPLICTTGADVIGNLTRSLNSYVKNGGSRRRAILATSQELTPRRRQNLERRAKEKGFELQQVYTQAAIADRLYRNLPWCRELLNLTGDPPALSVIPPTTRPLLDIPLVGRADDLVWLHAQAGDRLLVGQPGCGKTFLLHELAKAGGGLFVVNEDRGAVAAALREMRPSALIVDDAHLSRDLLIDLRQVRQETGLSFALIACCWPGEQAPVMEALSLTESQVHPLELLPRDQILTIIRSVGISGPDELLRELVDQAEGRPGLAVTLAHLCRNGGLREVTLGDALSRSITSTFTPLVGQRAADLLAGFSIGGRLGLPMATVARHFDLPLTEVRRDAARLAAGGVIQELSQNRLVVRPEGLRQTLVRDLFFQGALSLPILPFIDEAVHSDDVSGAAEVARTLIGARSRGGSVSDDLLLPLLIGLGPSSPWEEYAWLGRQETSYVLHRYPHLVAAVAGPALYYLPEEALIRLLDAAVAPGVQPQAAPSLQLIREWVRSGEPGKGQAVRRRRAVVGAGDRWLPKTDQHIKEASGEGDKQAQVIMQSVAIALSPQFQRSNMDPGLGNTVMISRGVLSLAEVREMHEVWAAALGLMKRLHPRHWKPIIETVDDWAYPGRFGMDESLSPTHGEVSDAMKSLARQMFSDLAPLVADHLGLLVSLNRIAGPLGLASLPHGDQVFTCLFPICSHHEWLKSEQKYHEAVKTLAARWAGAQPEGAARRLKAFEQEADQAGVTWPRLTQELCYELAPLVASPGHWARALADLGLPGTFIHPFLERAVALKGEDWTLLLRRFLGDSKQRGAAMICVLTLPDPPADLLDEALGFADGCEQLIEQSCLRGEVPTETLRRLLGHRDPAVATAAVTGMWTASRERMIPEELQAQWRAAVVRSRHDEYWLGEILSADQELAVDWLTARFTDEHNGYFGLPDNLQGVTARLDEPIRIGLLPLVPDCYGAEEVVGWLVGDSTSVYQALLALPQLKRYHLGPLGAYSDARGRKMTLQALEAGYSVSDVASALFPSRWSWSGDESLMWQQWVDQFSSLAAFAADANEGRLREVAEALIAAVQRCRDEALVWERREAVFGRRL